MENQNIYCNKPLNPDRLDALEGIEHDDNEYSEHLEGTIVESGEGRESVVNKLKVKSKVWKEFGAGKMVIQIIEGGLRLNFTSKVPVKYEEPNNKSFRENELFGVEEFA